MADPIAERITAYIRQNTSLAMDGIPAERWPLEELDSLEMLDLITFLETAFAIRVRDRDVRPENFGTIAALTELVKRRRGPGE